MELEIIFLHKKKIAYSQQIASVARFMTTKDKKLRNF